VSDTNITKTPGSNSAMARRQRLRRRIVPVVLAIVTILIGLMVHSGRFRLGPVAQDVLGDALWAALIAWLLGAIAPRSRLSRRTAVAFAVCVTVELSQLLHGPAIDAIRRTTPGQLVLGSGFDPRDLVAYAGGVLAAAVLESVIATWRETVSISGILLVTTLMAPGVMANQPGQLWVAFRYDDSRVLFYVATVKDPTRQDYAHPLPPPMATHGGGGYLLPLPSDRLHTFVPEIEVGRAVSPDARTLPPIGVALELWLGGAVRVPAVVDRYVEQWGNANPDVQVGAMAVIAPGARPAFRRAKSDYFVVTFKGAGPAPHGTGRRSRWRRTQSLNRFDRLGELRLEAAEAGWCVTLYPSADSSVPPTGVQYCYGD